MRFFDIRAMAVVAIGGAGLTLVGLNPERAVAAPAGAGAAAGAAPAAYALQVKAGVDAWTAGDYPAAVKAWQVPAARGDVDALFNMGQACKLGRGVPKDLIKAEEYYGKAAKLGHIRAADNYGILLFQTSRQREALPWIEAGADRGEPRAMYVLGVAAFNGDFAPKDWVRAYALMTRAASTGLPQAQTSLTTMNETIPLAQRQMGASLAADLERKTEDERARQLASADLGTPAPPRTPRTSTAPLTTVDLPPATTGSEESASAEYINPDPAPTVVAPTRVPLPPKPVLVQVAKPLPKPIPKPAPKAVASANEGAWRIQFGAFGVKANADALWAKLSNRSEVRGHPRIDAGAKIIRLQAGGFSQAGAERACASLKSGGFTCVAVAP